MVAGNLSALALHSTATLSLLDAPRASRDALGVSPPFGPGWH
ncbi:hypothetical protein [Streptomyces sp. NPDC087212]